MSDTDLIREVEEEIRREKLKKTWDKYGVYVLGAAVAIILIVAGQKFYEWYSKSEAEKAGGFLLKAKALEDAGKRKEADIAYGRLAAEGPSGYRTLSLIYKAANEAKDGDKNKAIKTYQQASENTSGDPLLAGLAQLQAAALSLETASFDEIKSKLDALTAPDNPWRHTARELIGLAAYKANKISEAETYYRNVLTDPKAPPGLRERAEMMLTLIVEAKDKSGPKKVNDGKEAETKEKKPADTGATN